MAIMNVIRIIENEKACVERASLPFGCDRHCEDCDLPMDSKDIIQAYDIVLDLLKKGEDDLK